MPNITPRASPPPSLYVYNIYICDLSSVHTHMHAYIYIYISLARGVWGGRNAWRSKKGGNYVYGVNEMRDAQSTSVRIHTHTHTFMYGIAATHIWIIWLNDEFRVLWVLFIVKGPGRTRSLEICVRGGREWGGIGFGEKYRQNYINTLRHKLRSNN